MRTRPLAAAIAALLSYACAGDQRQPVTRNPPPAAMPADEVIDDLEERTFRFFWETTNAANGLVPDRHPTPSFSSIAAVGFGLTAYGIGVERGYVSREDARARTLTTLRFFRDAPSGPDPAGMTGHKGFYYHFLDMKTGHRFKDTELSTVDFAKRSRNRLGRSGSGPGEYRSVAGVFRMRGDTIWVLDAMQILGPDLTRFRLRQALELLGGVSKKENKDWEKLLALIPA